MKNIHFDKYDNFIKTTCLKFIFKNELVFM